MWWGAAVDASKEAGVYLLIQEYSVALNVQGGPWQGDSFHHVIKEGANNFFQYYGHDNELYTLLYERICHDQDVDFEQVASDAHLSEMFDIIKDSPVLHRKGEKVKIGRWYSVFARAVDFRPHRAVLLLMLLYVGMRRKWWGRLDETPLFRQRAELPPEDAEGDAGLADIHLPDEARPPLGPSAASADVPRTTVAQSNRELARLRSSCKSTLHFVAQLLSDGWKMRLMDCISFVHEPLRQRFGLMETQCKTQRGREEWALSLARGEFTSDLFSALSVLDDPSVAHKLQFDQGGGAVDASVVEDRELAQHMLALALSLVGSFLLNWMSFSDGLLGYFVALLDPDAHCRRVALDRLRHWWECFERLEQDMIKTPALRTFHSNLLFPRLVWVREQMLAMLEEGFERMPDSVLREVRMMTRGFTHTKVVEDAFKVLRDRERHHPSGRMSALERWHRTHASDLLADNDCPSAPITLAAKMAASASLPPSTFQARKASNYECSLGHETLRTLPQPADWPTLNAAGHRLVPVAWAAYRELDGDPEQLGTNFLSLLAHRGVIIARRSDDGAWAVPPFMVLRSSQYGVLGWRVNATKCGDFSVAKFVAPWGDASPPWKVVPITDLKGWLALRTEARPSRTLPRGAQSGGCIAVCCVGKKMALCESAAKTGFRGMTVPLLVKLCRMLSVRLASSSSGRSEVAVVTKLLTHVEPDITKDEIKIRLELRGKIVEDNQLQSFLMEGANLQLVGDALDENDKKEIEEIKEKRNKAARSKTSASARQVSSAADSAAPSSSSAVATTSASSSNQGGKRQPPKLPRVDEADLEFGRHYMPARKGAVLSKDTTLHFRWQVLWPNDAPPYSVSKAWGGRAKLSELQALRIVLLQAWVWHETQGGESCPWDFSTWG